VAQNAPLRGDEQTPCHLSTQRQRLLAKSLVSEAHANVVTDADFVTRGQWFDLLGGILLNLVLGWGK